MVIKGHGPAARSAPAIRAGRFRRPGGGRSREAELGARALERLRRNLFCPLDNKRRVGFTDWQRPT